MARKKTHHRTPAAQFLLVASIAFAAFGYYTAFMQPYYFSNISYAGILLGLGLGTFLAWSFIFFWKLNKNRFIASIAIGTLAFFAGYMKVSGGFTVTSNTLAIIWTYFSISLTLFSFSTVFFVMGLVKTIKVDNDTIL